MCILGAIMIGFEHEGGIIFNDVRSIEVEGNKLNIDFYICDLAVVEDLEIKSVLYWDSSAYHGQQIRKFMYHSSIRDKFECCIKIEFEFERAVPYTGPVIVGPRYNYLIKHPDKMHNFFVDYNMQWDYAGGSTAMVCRFSPRNKIQESVYIGFDENGIRRF